MMINKRGSEKFFILISLILGLLVLSITTYFIFHEYFTRGDIDYEQCRQSILLRENLPEYEVAKLTPVSFKDTFPLKCKTRVVEIDKNDLESVNKIIAKEMASCWALFDKGDASAFPKNFITSKSVCVPCVRIHLTDEAKNEMKNQNKVINIRGALDERMSKDYSYWTYLQESGKKFSAFHPELGNPSSFNGNSFKIDSLNMLEQYVGETNKIGGEKQEFQIVGNVSFPKEFDPNQGDLIINYGITLFGGWVESEEYSPFLFYFQSDSKPSPFDEVKKSHHIGSVPLCEVWEGIPA